MKSSDRTILLGLAILGLGAAFWFLALTPKRDEVAKLDEQITVVRGGLQAQQQVVAAAQQAESDYDTNYQRLVVLGKAVPTDEDTSSLFVQLDEIAARTGVDFDAISLASGGGAAPAPPPAPAETTADGGETAPEDSSTTTETPTTTGAPATEAAAASLPIGATVGPAGLPVMPYEVKLTGDFFEISDFLASVDKLVQTGAEHPIADGRLITVDGFELAANATAGFPVLDASLRITTFVTPVDQGLTGGATPTLPPATLAAPTTTSATTP